MTASRSPKFIGAKLGVVSALALGTLPMIGSEAFALVIPTDTLQIGTMTPVGLGEGSEPSSISQGPVIFNESAGQNIIGTRTIVLLDPGTTSISDIVTATISAAEAPEFTLTVTLTSDGEMPLAPPAGTFSTLTEAGSPVNLGPNFTTLFGLTTPLPAINVFSDVESVPEPTSLALLGSGLAGLAFARRRRRRT